jgi:hypothetical protein
LLFGIEDIVTNHIHVLCYGVNLIEKVSGKPDELRLGNRYRSEANREFRLTERDGHETA